MKKVGFITLLVTCILVCSNIKVSADNFSMINDIVNAFSNDNNSNSIPTIKTAMDKFMQVNINASREDFSRIIDTKNISEIELLDLNEKMYNLGLFSLAEKSKQKISDENLDFYKKTVSEFYMPSYHPTLEEELFMASIYSSIYFNESPVSAVKELSGNKDLIKKSDYANYLLSLGYYKSNNFKEALNCINDAISMNNKCINYKFLKIKLLAEMGKRNEALILFNSYNNRKELPYTYRMKCELLKQFILYKTEKNQWERNYALGRYYYTEGNYQKALKSLQNATLTKNKKNLTRVWAMMSRTYLKLGDEKKAKDYAQRAYKNNTKNKDANVTLARLAYKENDYKHALTHFKLAVKDDKLDTSIIKVAQIYQQLDEPDKAKKIYINLQKKNKDDWQACYNLALLSDTDKENLLLKSLKYNPKNKYCFEELINLKIGNKEYKDAIEYLKDLYYLDNKDFKYYYYQGLVYKNLGDNVKAVKYFEECLKLNNDYYEAQKEIIELREYI